MPRHEPLLLGGHSLTEWDALFAETNRLHAPNDSSRRYHINAGVRASTSLPLKRSEPRPDKAFAALVFGDSVQDTDEPTPKETVEPPLELSAFDKLVAAGMETH